MTFDEIADSMRTLAAEYRQKADALEKALAALEGDTTQPATVPAPTPQRSSYAPVGAPEPTLACPLEGCGFVARGVPALGVHLARRHGIRGNTVKLRRQRAELVAKAKRGEKVAAAVPSVVPVVPDQGSDGDEPVESAATSPQEPPADDERLEPAISIVQPHEVNQAPFARVPFDPDAVRARAAEGI